MQQTISTRQKTKAIIQLFRPELPTAAGLCVVIGELLALGAVPQLPVLALGFACGFFLSASALITNDYFDVEVDRINAPQRPLPAGLVSRSTAMALGLLAALLGLAAALALNPLALGFSLIVWLLGFLYNWRLKAAGLWGNLIVSGSVGATLVLGGIAVGEVASRTVWVFGLLVFFFDLAEEIAGDAMDAEGDRERASKSVALRHGRRAALRLTGVLVGVVILLSLLLISWGGPGLEYRLVIPLMDVLIIVFAVRLVTSHSDVQGRRAMRGMYLSASAGLLAFLVVSLLT